MVIIERTSSFLLQVELDPTIYCCFIGIKLMHSCFKSSYCHCMLDLVTIARIPFNIDLCLKTLHSGTDWYSEVSIAKTRHH